jgi:hypothetical protein
VEELATRRQHISQRTVVRVFHDQMTYLFHTHVGKVAPVLNELSTTP